MPGSRASVSFSFEKADIRCLFARGGFGVVIPGLGMKPRLEGWRVGGTEDDWRGRGALCFGGKLWRVRDEL